MDPVHQIQTALNENDDDDIESDRVQELKRRRVVFISGIGSESRRDHEARENVSRETTGTIGDTLHNNMDVFGVTPFDEAGKSSTEIRGLVAALAVGDRPRLPAAAAMYCKRIVTGFDHLLPRQDPHTRNMQRRLYRYHQTSAAKKFNQLLMGSAKMSPMVRVIMQYAEKNDLASFKHMGWFMQRFTGNMTLNRYWSDKMLTIFELVFKVNNLHGECLAAQEYSLDAYRHALNLHLNLLLLSNRGASGKSAVFEILEKLRIPGSVEILTYETAAAKAIDADAEGGGLNQSDRICIFDEVPPDLIGAGGDKNSEQTSRQRMVMTKMFTSYRSLRFLDDGTRVPTGSTSLWVGVYFGAANLRSADVSDPMMTRWDKRALSESADPKGRQVENCMEEAARDKHNITDLMRQVQMVCYQEQLAHCWIEKMIHAGVIADVSTHGMVLFLAAFREKLREKGLFQVGKVRNWERVHLSARLKCIKQAWLTLVADGRFDSLSTEAIISIEPMLFITVEQVIMTIAEQAEALLAPLPAAIRRCLKDLYLSKVHDADPGASEIQRESIQQKNLKQIYVSTGDAERRDFNYWAHARDDLVSEILAQVPKYLGGHKPSKEDVRGILAGFSQQTHTSHPHDMKYDQTTRLNYVTEDTTKRPRDYITIKESRSAVINSQVCEIHVGWLMAASGVEGNIKAGLQADMVDIVQELMTAKHQINRAVAFGQSSENHEELQVFQTRKSPHDNGMFKVKNWTHITDKNHDLLPEYREQVNSATAANQDTILMGDIDLYALKQRSAQLALDGTSVSGNFSDVIAEQIGDDDVFDYFGTKVFSEDHVERLGLDPAKVAALKDAAGREDPVDDQFCREDYRDAEGHDHWLVVPQYFDAEDLGFMQWADEEAELIKQYKMIRWHPLVMHNFRQSTAERRATQQQGAPVVVAAPPAAACAQGQVEERAVFGRSEMLEPLSESMEAALLPQDAVMVDAGDA
jgi:hypothetical protein